MKLPKKKTLTIADLLCSISCTLLVCQSTSPKGMCFFYFGEGLNEFVITDGQGNYNGSVIWSGRSDGQNIIKANVVGLYSSSSINFVSNELFSDNSFIVEFTLSF